MALQLYQLIFSQSSFVSCKQELNIPKITVGKSRQRHSIRCVSKTEVSQVDMNSGIYQPTTWTQDFIDVQDTNVPINFKKKAKELEKKVTVLSVDYENRGLNTLQMLEHIDDIEKLGIGYLFEDDIKRTLDLITSINGNNVPLEEKQDSLHAASLRFRLLRQHGYHVSQDFLRSFKDNHGGFMGHIQTDVKGLLSLYEASYLAFETEKELHDAKLFATEHLLKLKDRENEAFEHMINHALELPSYRRMLRLQTRWYINAYGKRKDANLLLLELAILDFNIVQAAYKTELQQVSKWWKNIGLASKLCFVRDRLMECFFWTVGVVFEPQYHSSRVALTKVCTLITVIDDIYDVYGSLYELELFKDAVKRWDINETKHMPEYLQIGFRALYSIVMEMGSNTSVGQGEGTISVLVQVWGELVDAFFVEATWTHEKYIPKLQDYLDNGWRSVSGVVILTHGYFLIKEIKKDVVIESLEKYHDLMKWSSMIFRLCNDLGTSSDEIERGKTANAISCYMHENDVSEEVAREYIKTLIDEAWKKVMRGQADFRAGPMIDMAINLARISHCTYQYGDGHGAPDARARDRVQSVIIDPITMS